MYTSIDLFSGPGGLCTGLKWANIKPLIAVEMSHWTVETYIASHDADVFPLNLYLNGQMHNLDSFLSPNTKTLLIHGDITLIPNSLIDEILWKRFNTRTVDLVTGGAPCESFSLAGSRKEEDDRNNLFLNIDRIAKHVNAKMLLFENVKGLLSKKNCGVTGGMYELICNQLELPNEDGVSFRLASRNKNVVLLKASNYGVPQDRERVFLVGINSIYNSSFKYPDITHGPGEGLPYVTVSDAIDDLPIINSKEGDEEFFHKNNVNSKNYDIQRETFLNMMNGNSLPIPDHLKDKKYFINSHKGPGHTIKMIRRFENILEGEGMKKASERLLLEGKGEVIDSFFPNKIYAARNRRLIKNKPSFTVTSHCLDEMVHPTLNRSITPREAARLQSFPDWYQFRGPYVKFHSDPEQDRYEQIGDAIPPLLGYVLGLEINKTLKNIHSENSHLVEKVLVNG